MPYTKKPDTAHTFSSLVQRTAVPFCLFTAVLTGLLAVSSAAVLPALLSVEIGGQVRDLQDVHTYYEKLQQEIEVQEQERNALVLPLEGSPYRSLVDWKKQQYPLNDLLAAVSQAGKMLSADSGTRTVFLQSTRYDPAEQRLELTGAVRNVGPRSMTVLAQFVDLLQQEHFVESVDHPTFTRIEEPSGVFFSPFHLTLSLQ